MFDRLLVALALLAVLVAPLGCNPSASHRGREHSDASGSNDFGEASHREPDEEGASDGSPDVRAVFVSASWRSDDEYSPRILSSEASLAESIESASQELVDEGYRIVEIFPVQKGTWAGAVDYANVIHGGVGFGQTSGVIIVAQR